MCEQCASWEPSTRLAFRNKDGLSWLKQPLDELLTSDDSKWNPCNRSLVKGTHVPSTAAVLWASWPTWSRRMQPLPFKLVSPIRTWRKLGLPLRFMFASLRRVRKLGRREGAFKLESLGVGKPLSGTSSPFQSAHARLDACVAASHPAPLGWASGSGHRSADFAILSHLLSLSGQ